MQRTLKKSQKLSPRTLGGAHHYQFWNLSSPLRAASYETGIGLVAPLGEEIFGFKVLTLPLNSPKTGGPLGAMLVFSESSPRGLSALKI